MDQKVRTRFAPSPTGYMHVGNLRTALYEYLVARVHNGKFILRIEDTDQERYVPEAIDIIYQTLRDVNIIHDEGPDVGGNYGPYIQSERKDIYKEYATKLVELGGAHYCFCAHDIVEDQRADEENKSFKYEDPCKKLSKDEIKNKLANQDAFVIRQTIKPEGITSFKDAVYGEISIENKMLDEGVLLKSDGLPTYNFANVVDDHLMEITHVIRGNEYLSSTPKYNLIYNSFGWQVPEYIHLPPVMKDAKSKLSKRNGDASFQDLIAKGYLADAIVNYLALLGWNPGTDQEIFSLEELSKIFSVERIHSSPAIFDVEKLKWLNAQYIKKMDDTEFHRIALNYYPSEMKGEFETEAISKILKPRVVIFSDIPDLVQFFLNLPEYSTDLYTNQKMKIDPASSLIVLKEIKGLYNEISDWNEASIHDKLMGLVSQLNLKTGQVMWPLRVALSGQSTSPGGAIELSLILGCKESLERINVGIKIIEESL